MINEVVLQSQLRRALEVRCNEHKQLCYICIMLRGLIAGSHSAGGPMSLRGEEAS
jgi:hypothetical protein